MLDAIVRAAAATPARVRVHEERRHLVGLADHRLAVSSPPTSSTAAKMSLNIRETARRSFSDARLIAPSSTSFSGGKYTCDGWPPLALVV